MNFKHDRIIVSSDRKSYDRSKLSGVSLITSPCCNFSLINLIARCALYFNSESRSLMQSNSCSTIHGTKIIGIFSTTTKFFFYITLQPYSATSKRAKKREKNVFFSNYREGCGLFGLVDFDFVTIKKINTR